MGRGSDTRMYSPRSESDKMYSSANEDEGKYGRSDSEYNEMKREEKKRKAEEKKAKRAKVKHIKIRASQGLSGEESSSPLDDGNKRDDEREIGLQGGPAGSRGTLLDLATGAKSGTGSAMSPGLPIAMSEPMKDAWSSLLKQDPHVHDVGDGSDEDTQRYFDEKVRPEVMNPGTPRPHAMMKHKRLEEKINRMYQGLEDYDEDLLNEYNYRMVENDLNAQGSAVSDAGFDYSFQDINTSEPMEDAWSTLLKASLEDLIQERDRLFQSGLKQEAKQFDHVIQQMMRPDRQEQQMLQNIGVPTARLIMPELEGEELEDIGREIMYDGRQNPDYIEMQRRMGGYDPQTRQEFMRNVSRMSRRMPKIDEAREQAQQSLQNLQATDPSRYFADQEVMTGEPMEDAWGDLLKRETPRTIAGRRRREARQQFRPSTGQFKTPPGGMSGGVGATMRRFKAQMRGIKSGKKTGLMKPHLSVEMSHRGIQTKQPLSKDPQKYTQYKGQSEARKILGNVRTPFSPHARYGARSNYAGPTGAGRLGGLMPGQRGQMARPALRRMRRPRMPRMPRMSAPRPPTPPMMPQMQSSVPSAPIMMSEEQYRSELLKSRNTLRRIELLNLMRRLIQAKEREAKLKKSEGIKPNSGHLPAHPAGVEPSDDEDPDGPTENLETDAKTFGLDPVGIINSRRGHM